MRLGMSAVSAVALGVLMTASGWAEMLSPEAVSARLDEASALVQSGQYSEAVYVYQTLANVKDDALRAQTRYGLAVALNQLGDDAQAVKALEGTDANQSPLGQAVGNLRGNLILNLAEKSLLETGTAGRWLADYDRLIQKPSQARAERLHALDDSAAPAGDPLRVGVLLPLTGPQAAMGMDALHGLQLAINDLPGWRNATVELYPHDTATGARAALDAALVQGAKVIVGPLLAADVAAIAPAIRAVDVPVLTLSTDRSVTGEGLHAVTSSPADQARVVADWASANGHMQVAGLVPSAPYGTDVMQAFQHALEAKGGHVAKISFFNPKNVDLGAAVRQLVGKAVSGTTLAGTLPFTALFIPTSAQSLPLITSQLAYYDLDKAKIQLLGTGLWQDNALLAPSARGANGAVFGASAKPVAVDDVIKNTYGEASKGLAATGYDVGRILLQLAAERAWSGRDVGLLLERPEGFYGSGGYYRFRPDGRTERGLSLVRIENGQFHVVQPALSQVPFAVPPSLKPSVQGGGVGGWW